jgi:hypothetical protein
MHPHNAGALSRIGPIGPITALRDSVIENWLNSRYSIQLNRVRIESREIEPAVDILISTRGRIPASSHPCGTCTYGAGQSLTRPAYCHASCHRSPSMAAP